MFDDMKKYRAREAKSLTPNEFSKQKDLYAGTSRNTKYQKMLSLGKVTNTHPNYYDAIPVSRNYFPQTAFNLYNREPFDPCYYKINEALYPTSNEANPLSKVSGEKYEHE